jgi:hypothetical protein
MITSKQYLKDYKEMNEMEKQSYLRRVEKWNSETFPELLALAECWERVPVKDFDEGCLLVSAITNSHPFLNDIQRYTAKVAVKKLNLYLEKVRKASGLANRSTRGPVGTEHFRAVVPQEPLPDEDGNPQPVKEYVEPEIDNRRPKDFVLYKDKLPKDLQVKGEKWLKDMYLELADYRGNLEVMADNPQISDAARKDMADKVLATEQAIRAFWAEVDAAYNGEVSPSSYTESGEYLSGMKRPGDFTRAEIEAMTDIRQQELCRKARIEGNKKYINRNDVKITDEYREQLSLRIRELMEWGENLPRKTAEVATNAGVFIEGVNKEAGEEKKQEISESKEEISKTEEKVSGNAEKFPKSDVKPAAETSSTPENIQQTKEPAPSKAVDPTELVTEGKMQKGGTK